MKRLVILAAALTVACACSAGAFTENFDSYADQAAFNAVWGNSGSPVALSNNQWVSSPNSVYQGTAAVQSRILLSNPVPAQQLKFSFMFYDETGTGSLARAYGMVYARSGNLWTDSLQQIIAVGKYNSVATTKYFARIAFGSLNWFVLDAPTSPDRSVGWHKAEVIGAVDPNDPTKAQLSFYIDGQLGKTVGGVANSVFNFVVLGSGLTSTHGMYFDDVSVVPEPGSLLALGSGLVGMAGLLLRRRA
mgnify:CR=1 FL=1|jgi:hypothetical protein